ncbi:unnamed protein product [Dicrocoelium dendriticum]|nr:unnamed protein product [Dicrocoelium dendriticum]
MVISVRESMKNIKAPLRNFQNMMLLLLVCYWSTFVYASMDPYDPDECITIDSTTSSGTVYQGKLNKAFDGTECQPWSAHPHFYRSHWSKEKAKQEQNYCRNPDNDSHGPWCVVHKTTFKYCNVPRCAKDVECYEGNGEEYSGFQDRTAEGVPCKTWTQTSVVRTSRKLYRFRIQENETHSSVLRTTDDLLDNFQYCRNPAGSKSRPWCYTIPVTGMKSEYSYCDVPKCSDPSPLGYINSGSGSPCADGFVQQTQTVLFEGKRNVKITYCLAPIRLLYPKQRQPQYAPFTDFCLYLMEEFTFCPAGFRRTERFQSNFGLFKHFSGPSAWRATSDNILQHIFCCTEPHYFRNHTLKPYIMVEKVARYKPHIQDISEVTTLPLNRLRQTRQTADVQQPSTKSKNYSLSFDPSEEVETYSSSDVMFASVRRCPVVEGTTRVLLSKVRPQKNSEQRIDLMFTLPEEVVCEYYAVKSGAKSQHPQKVKSPSKLGLLFNQPECPPAFRKLQISRQVMLLLGASTTICEPLENQLDLLKQSLDGYCAVVTPDETTVENGPQHSSESEWGIPSEFLCPQGFRPNELHFTQPVFRLKLCCTGQSNELRKQESMKAGEPDRIQFPSSFNYPFSLIRNGERCPTIYAGSIKLNLIQYTRPIPASTVDNLELIGTDDPVAPSDTLGITVCQYLSQNMKVGVKSLNYDCDGLGNLSSMTYDGATCGFEVNETFIFPPGKYCLLQLSASCPSGFTHRSGMMRLGFSLQALGNTCCRTEETIGAIRLPIKMAAPFKLPAVYRPCQAIENFNVDAELHHCVYYPQGETPQALIMWPRIVGKVVADPMSKEDYNISATTAVSTPMSCAVMPRKRKKVQRGQLGRLTTLFFSMMQDQWLIYKRPRWTNTMIENGDVCFIEVPWSLLPPESQDERKYCIFAFGSCPKPREYVERKVMKYSLSI